MSILCIVLASVVGADVGGDEFLCSRIQLVKALDESVDDDANADYIGKLFGEF